MPRIDFYTGLSLFDPPHGDYYSNPSQPHAAAVEAIGGGDHDAWMRSDAQSAAWVADRIEEWAARRIALDRQSYQEPHAVRTYFWLGRDAENF